MRTDADHQDVACLLEDESFLRELVSHTSEGLLTIDTNSRIIFANPAIEDILGYEPAELVGSPKMKIIPERLRAAHKAGFDAYLETGTRHIDWSGVELPARHKDGHEVMVSVSFTEHEYNGERIFTGVFSDISDQKQREQELRKQKRRLEELADVLSHDLRNPISVIRGNLALLKGQQDDSDTVRRISDAVDRIEQIIEDTLQHAHDTDVVDTTELLSLRNVVRRAWTNVPTEEASLTAPAESWQIRAQRGRLTQLIENVIRNAVEHVGADVSVTVGLLEDADGFFIEDDGPGLPSSVAVQLEVPSGPDKGVPGGYGLQIIETVAEEHGWQTTITEGGAGGVRFEFRGVTVSQG